MNILFQLSHPAHFHLYKHTIHQLMDRGHKVHILIKTKDILEDLLLESRIPYHNILPFAHRKNKLGIFWDMIVRDWKILKYSIQNHIDLLVGSTVEVDQVGWLLRKHRINMGEDDISIIPLFLHMGGPFVGSYLAPTSCNMGKLEPKTVHYPGYHKLAYLHPNYFQPDKAVVEKYFSTSRPYFLLRFAELNAYHDSDACGLNTDIAQHLIDLLKPHGDIYITSERTLEPQFEQYRLNINPLDIHHIMAFASIYIGDSQSMAVEAAMLGIPSIRFNTFAGKIGVLEELQDTYKLTVGIHSSKPELLYNVVKTWLNTPNLNNEFQQRRKKLLQDKIDVTAFFTWFIENYPQSKREIASENFSFDKYKVQ